MIINETKYNYEDVKFLYSVKNLGIRVVVARIIFILGGLLVLASFGMSITKNIPWFKALFAGNAVVDPQGVLALCFFLFELLFGIACLVMCVVYDKFLIKQIYQRHYKKAPERHIEISSDQIQVTSKSRGVKEESTFDFSRVKGYTIKNDALYVQLEGQGGMPDVYMALHNNGYKRGSLEDVLELMKKHHRKELN